MKLTKSLALAVIAALMVGCGSKDGGGNGTTGDTSGKTGEAKPVTLRLNLNKGEKWTETMTGDVRVDATDFKAPEGASPSALKEIEEAKNSTGKFTMTNEYEVIETGTDKIKIKRTTVAAKGEGTGPLGQMTKFLEEEKGKSKEKSFTAKNVESEFDKQSPAFAVEFPEQMVKVGDSWEGLMNFMGTEGKGKYKLELIEEVNGKKCAKISCTPTNTEKVDVTEPVMMWIDVATGKTVKGSMHTKMKDGPGGLTMLFNIDIEMK